MCVCLKILACRFSVMWGRARRKCCFHVDRTYLILSVYVCDLECMSQSSSMIYTQTLKHVWSYWRRGNAFLKLNSSLESLSGWTPPSISLPALFYFTPTVATFVHLFYAFSLLYGFHMSLSICFRFVSSYFNYFLLIVNFLFFALWATFFYCSVLLFIFFLPFPVYQFLISYRDGQGGSTSCPTTVGFFLFHKNK